MVLIKDKRVYYFKGPRDEMTLRQFILKTHHDFESTKVPDELPTFFENVQEALSQMVQVMIQIYRSDNTMAKVVLSFLFGIIFVLLSAICYFSCCGDSEPDRYSARASHVKKQSVASQRTSAPTDKSRMSEPSEGGVKRRSKARKRD